jgi:hypothetical protein
MIIGTSVPITKPKSICVLRYCQHLTFSATLSASHLLGKEAEPSISVALLELAGTFGSTDTSSRILATNADTQKESVCRQRSEHALDAAARSV